MKKLKTGLVIAASLATIGAFFLGDMYGPRIKWRGSVNTQTRIEGNNNIIDASIKSRVGQIIIVNAPGGIIDLSVDPTQEHEVKINHIDGATSSVFQQAPLNEDLRLRVATPSQVTFKVVWP